MKRYVVEQMTSGYVLGTYRAENWGGAIRAMLKDSGDDSEPDENLVATEIAEGQPDIEPNGSYTVKDGLAYLADQDNPVW